jgi:hypothetical protein
LIAADGALADVRRAHGESKDAGSRACDPAATTRNQVVTYRTSDDREHPGIGDAHASNVALVISDNASDEI